MLPIRNISYLSPMYCSFWEKCKKQSKNWPGVQYPLKELKIAKVTKRGYRGGKLRRIFTIPSRVTSSRIDSTSTLSVRESNLIRVPLSNNTSATKRKYPLSRLATWNAGSLKKKTTSITDFVIDHKIDLLTITESWLTGDDRDNYPLADLSYTLPHFCMHHVPRKHKKGGGVFLLSHKGLQVTENQLKAFKSFSIWIFMWLKQNHRL